MIRLALLRHAKAVGDGGAGGDHARVLAERGRRDATRVGLRLLDAGFVPDRVLVSDSARTRETWALASEALLRTGHRPEVTFDRRLYLADPEQVATVCRDLGDAAGTLLLVGHNPGWEALATQLVGRPLAMPTAGMALLHARRPGRWADLLGAERSFQLAHHLLPDG